MEEKNTLIDSYQCPLRLSVADTVKEIKKWLVSEINKTD